ncbi:IGR protein motif-domain-containing protein [Thelephora terrestris]|uniref:Small ribosomal subunit protein mS41 n=1 Tax=Thelephora terrestris TaxID=56493 RepID=A0A9P6HB59_9AGAM|nr:IGR protein motif-domain-containing protein [Thelephora terrestris]
MLSSVTKFTSLVPSLTRCLQTATAAASSMPAPRGSICSAEDFLKSIGRSAETKLKVEKWAELWKLDSSDLKRQGLDVKDRRYILWAMQKYRLGSDPTEFAHAATPKKKIRGWGPSVQNGKRIRSRRHR